VALANEAYYRRAPRSRQGELQTIGAFFHPLDAIRNWNRVYGPGGFRQYQYGVPFGQEAAVRRSFELVSRARAARLDARARRTRTHSRAGRPAGRARPPGRRRGRPGLPGQGLPRAARHAGGDVPAARGVPQAAGRARPGRNARLGPVPPAAAVTPLAFKEDELLARV